MTLRKINVKTIRQIVYDQLKKSITTAELFPGQKINIRQLAEKLGVSPMPVREALWQLESERVILIESNKSITVNKLTHEELDQIRWIRLTLETMAAQRACELRLDSDILALKNLVSSMKESFGRIKEYLRINKEMHFGIYRLAESPILMGIIDNLWARIAPYFNIQYLGPEFIKNIAMPCHEKMVKALADRDKTVIAEALYEDITNAAQRIHKLLDPEEVYTSPLDSEAKNGGN